MCYYEALKAGNTVDIWDIFSLRLSCILIASDFPDVQGAGWSLALASLGDLKNATAMPDTVHARTLFLSVIMTVMTTTSSALELCPRGPYVFRENKT